MDGTDDGGRAGACPARVGDEVGCAGTVGWRGIDAGFKRYSTARSGLLYAARSATTTCSRSNPMSINSLTVCSSAGPTTRALSPPRAPPVTEAVGSGAAVRAGGAIEGVETGVGTVTAVGATGLVDGAAVVRGYGIRGYKNVKEIKLSL